jgi:heme exporter protein A
MVVIHLENLALRIMGRWVMSHVQAQVSQGAQVLLTGANGAGKTTLLRLLATALRPTRGTVCLFGLNPQASRQQGRRRLALMTHHHHFYEPLTARQNLTLVGQLTQNTDGVRHQALLAEVGLAAHADRPVGTYSAGMKRRLALARVNLLQPELVLLDEPFGQLDPQGVVLMQNAITAMAARGATVVMATHDIARGQALCQVHWRLGEARTGLHVTTLGRGTP